MFYATIFYDMHMMKTSMHSAIDPKTRVCKLQTLSCCVIAHVALGQTNWETPVL